MAHLAPVQLNSKRRRMVMAMPPPPSPSALTLVKALISLARVVSTCGKPKVCQKRNASNLVRRIDLLVPFLEEISESPRPIPPSTVMAFRELHGVMQRAAMLLDECRESSCFWLLLEQETYCQQFHELTQSLGSALDPIPLALLDLSDEVYEQTVLVRLQVQRARLSLDPAELQLREDIISLIKLVESKAVPDIVSVRNLFTRLLLLSVTDCQTEVHRLEEMSLEVNRVDTNTKTKTENGFASLMSFVRYGKCLLYSAVVADQEADTEGSRNKAMTNGGHQQSEEVSTSGRTGESGVLICPPDEFLCPVTLDVMRDPVIVATGQTYDRASIARWFEGGHVTCPKSGQKLAHKNLIPNYALRSLIVQWCEDNDVEFEKRESKSKKGAGLGLVAYTGAALEATRLTASFLVDKLATGSVEIQKQVAYELRLLAKCGMENRMCIAEAGGIPHLVPLLSSSDPKTQEHAVTAMLNLSILPDNKKLIISAGGLDPIIEVLKSGRTMESRENAAATLFSLSVRDELKVQIGSNLDAIPYLVALLREGSVRRGKKDAATALFNLAVYNGNKPKIIEAGAVPTLVGLLKSESESIADDCLAVLALLAGVPEGVAAIVATTAIPTLVSLMRSGSPKGKENSTAVLLALSRSGEEKVIQAVLQISTTVPSLYSLLTMGTLRAKRKAGSLLKVLHRWEQQTSTTRNRAHSAYM